MRKESSIYVLFCVLMLYSCSRQKNRTEFVLPSPDMKSHIYFNLNNGEPWFLIFHNSDIIVDWSKLGVTLKDQTKFSEELTFDKSSSVSAQQDDLLALKNEQPLKSPFNEMIIFLKKPEVPSIVFKIIFRAYNDGLTIAYDFETGTSQHQIELISEETQFNLYDKAAQWTLKEPFDTLSASIEPDEIVLPALFISSKGFEVTITESNVNNYPEMKLIRTVPGKPKYQFHPDIPDGASFTLTPGVGSSYKVIRVSEIIQPEKNSNEGH